MFHSKTLTKTELPCSRLSNFKMLSPTRSPFAFPRSRTLMFQAPYMYANRTMRWSGLCQCCNGSCWGWVLFAWRFQWVCSSASHGSPNEQWLKVQYVCFKMFLLDRMGCFNGSIWQTEMVMWIDVAILLLSENAPQQRPCRSNAECALKGCYQIEVTTTTTTWLVQWRIIKWEPTPPADLKKGSSHVFATFGSRISPPFLSFHPANMETCLLLSAHFNKRNAHLTNAWKFNEIHDELCSRSKFQ